MPWSAVDNAEPYAKPPELRLTDGRTIFIHHEHRAALAAGLATAGVTVMHRPDIWSYLLEPFLDNEYDEVTRTGCEERLRSYGLTNQDIRAIRHRVRLRMTAMTFLSWEWAGYGHVDVLEATAWLMPASRYVSFRKWADTIAAAVPPQQLVG
nr:hypothetical protein GCM10020063_024400 [Dactylosporangium thailandense]